MKKTILIAPLLSLAFLASCGSSQSTKCCITFDTGEGVKPIEAQYVNRGQKATKPEDPSKDHFDFQFWYLDNQAEQFNFDTPIEKSIVVLHAKWEEIDSEVCTFSFTGQNCTIKNQEQFDSKFYIEDSVQYRIDANEGYTLPDPLNVETYSDIKYVKSAENIAFLTIRNTNPEVRKYSFELNAIEKTYLKINYTLENCYIDQKTGAFEEKYYLSQTNVKIRLVIDSGHRFPLKISDLETQSIDYITYDSDSGILSIDDEKKPKESKTINLHITAPEGSNTFSHVAHAKNCTISFEEGGQYSDAIKGEVQKGHFERNIYIKLSEGSSKLTTSNFKVYKDGKEKTVGVVIRDAESGKDYNQYISYTDDGGSFFISIVAPAPVSRTVNINDSLFLNCDCYYIDSDITKKKIESEETTFEFKEGQDVRMTFVFEVKPVGGKTIYMCQSLYEDYMGYPNWSNTFSEDHKVCYLATDFNYNLLITGGASL